MLCQALLHQMHILQKNYIWCDITAINPQAAIANYLYDIIIHHLLCDHLTSTQFSRCYYTGWITWSGYWFCDYYIKLWSVYMCGKCICFIIIYQFSVQKKHILVCIKSILGCIILYGGFYLWGPKMCELCKRL